MQLISILIIAEFRISKSEPKNFLFARGWAHRKIP